MQEQRTAISEAERGGTAVEMADELDQPAEPVVELKRGEHEEAEQRSAVRAPVVYEAIRREGEDELRRPVQALAWSGFAAGLSMGFSLVAQGLLRAGLPDAPWRPLVANVGYSIGFLIVILGRQQLFTENTLTVILPLLARRSRLVLWRVARLWVVVLAANLAGALVFAWVVGNTEVFRAAPRQAFHELGHEALSGGFGTIVLRGIFAGWLIALMVWLLPAAEGARVQIIIIVTYLVGLAGLAHIIAGSIEVLYLVTTGEASALDFLGRFMLPTLIGNIIGGVSLVAALNHAQVVAGAATAQ
ncbi:MAG TPA: formate/nitrite transporter family protein [Dehalococcoidia bacterium]|nr:formate/nitrite transporter family protein [Dehalococcoidia bacterium]